MLDLFSGIGGFHEGFKRAGYQFDWVGFSEIDKYASAVYKYNYKESEELGDITAIRPERDLPDNIDILCGGFPCQAFSMAGKRLGFDDTRGTLFFEIARILTYYREKQRPIRCLVLENVKGLLSHDDGRTFATIYRVLDNLGYTIEFQLLNTRWWLPQNRERIYIVGYIGNRGGPQVFPIGEDGERNNEKRFPRKTTTGHKQGMLNSKDRRRRTMLRESEKIEIVGNTKSGGERSKIHSSEGISSTLTATDYKQAKQVMVIDKKGNKKNNQDYAATLCGGGHSGGNHSDMDLIKVQKATQPKKIEIIGNLKGKGGHECHNVHSIEGIAPAVRENHGKTTMVQPVLTPNRANKRQNGRRFKEDGEDMFTLKQQDQHGVMIRDGRDNRSCLRAGRTPELGVKGQSIRRLTPVECMRLQGFSDDHNKYGIIDDKVVEISDTQRYKQAGNAVTVDVVQAVATIIKEKEII